MMNPRPLRRVECRQPRHRHLHHRRRQYRRHVIVVALLAGSGAPTLRRLS
jgi:hypothetical protein